MKNNATSCAPICLYMKNKTMSIAVLLFMSLGVKYKNETRVSYMQIYTTNQTLEDS